MNERSFKLNLGDSEMAPTKRDQASAQRRRHILECAITCFVEVGYHQTGMREIAKRAEVSLGNLYNHFKGKHEVLAEIAVMEQREMTPLLELLRGDGPADTILMQFATAYTDGMATPEIAILTLEITSEAIRQPDIAELFAGSRAELLAGLTKLIHRGGETGDLKQVESAKDSADLLLDLFEGAAYRIALVGEPRTKVLRTLKDFVGSAMCKPKG